MLKNILMEKLEQALFPVVNQYYFMKDKYEALKQFEAFWEESIYLHQLEEAALSEGYRAAMTQTITQILDKANFDKEYFDPQRMEFEKIELIQRLELELVTTVEQDWKSRITAVHTKFEMKDNQSAEVVFPEEDIKDKDISDIFLPQSFRQPNFRIDRYRVTGNDNSKQAKIKMQSKVFDHYLNDIGKRSDKNKSRKDSKNNSGHVLMERG